MLNRFDSYHTTHDHILQQLNALENSELVHKNLSNQTLVCEFLKRHQDGTYLIWNLQKEHVKKDSEFYINVSYVKNENIHHVKLCVQNPYSTHYHYLDKGYLPITHFANWLETKKNLLRTPLFSHMLFTELTQKLPYYFPNIDREAATKLLSNKPDGSFLVRNSSVSIPRKAQYYYLAVSFVRDAKVENSLVCIHSGRSKIPEVRFANPLNFASDIRNHILAKSKSLHTPLLAPAVYSSLLTETGCAMGDNMLSQLIPHPIAQYIGSMLDAKSVLACAMTESRAARQALGVFKKKMEPFEIAPQKERDLQRLKK